MGWNYDGLRLWWVEIVVGWNCDELKIGSAEIVID